MTTTKTVGRESGTLVAGSLPWQLAQLKPGDALLFPDGPYRSQGLNVAMNRFAAAHGGRFALAVCIGTPQTFDGTAFRFYRITRIE
ncbi:hypothetical protein AB3X94_37355 [Paraburkholderia sp. BR10923]|uniref:hypothetical protein n=1 Tax=Paraburkholderia sp. BR10923 TaxID=3236992 RepID=UPI0034CD73C6